MKYLDIPVGGMPIHYNNNLSHLSEAAVEAGKALVRLLGNNVYLGEMAITINGMSQRVPSAGWMLFNGQLCEIDTTPATVIANGVDCWEAVYVAAVGDPLTFANSQVYSPHKNKKVRLISAAAGAPPVSEHVFASAFSHRGAALYTAMKGYRGDWTTVGSGGSSFAAGYSHGSRNMEFRGSLAESFVELRGTFDSNVSRSASIGITYLQVANLGLLIGANRIAVANILINSDTGVAGDALSPALLKLESDGKLYIGVSALWVGLTDVCLDGIRLYYGNLL